MQATLAEVLIEDADTRFITLGCGHLFTVETLDGHVDFKQCYEITDKGVRLGLRVPDSGAFTSRPTCPTCRGPIASPRYNRVVKRALLDIQEQHAIHDRARDITKARETIAAFDFAKTSNSVADVYKNINPPKGSKMPTPKQLDSYMSLTPDDVKCFISEHFSDNLRLLFHIDGPMAAAWRRLVEVPMRVYKQLGHLVNQDALPHVLAYEAAVTGIYRQEMVMVESRKGGPGGNPHERAMRVAKMRVGAPFPKGDGRFKIEALQETIKIRLELAPIALAISHALQVDTSSYAKRASAGDKVASSQRFLVLALALVRSCRRDADLATNLSIKTEAKRLRLSSELLAIQAHFDHFRLRSTSRVAVFAAVSTVREEEASKSAVEMGQARARFETAISEVLEEVADNKSPLAELVETAIRPGATIVLDEWVAYGRSILTGTFYAPVSTQERREIARAVLKASWGESRSCP